MDRNTGKPPGWNRDSAAVPRTKGSNKRILPAVFAKGILPARAARRKTPPATAKAGQERGGRRATATTKDKAAAVLTAGKKWRDVVI
jgi:hypothetical protein